MIVQVVGTNGAGKSTVVRAVMARGCAHPAEVDGQRVGYDLELAGVEDLVHVVGVYGSAATGGCDTIRSSQEEIYERVVYAARSRHVLFEGIRTLNQTTGPRYAALTTAPWVILLLTTPLGVSIQSIDARRAARGTSPFTRDIRDIAGNHKRARNYAARMRDAGARVVRASREEAPQVVLGLLLGI